MTDFFEAQRDQSRVKSEIVARYFDVWSSVIQNVVARRSDRRIAYVDLFSGPGLYADGSYSTPLMVMQRAHTDATKRAHLVTVFNDQDLKCVEALKAALDDFAGLSDFSHRPVVMHQDAGTAMQSVRSRLAGVPALYFVDPFGYKGVTLDMLHDAIKDWGSEFILFFNYNRVNQAVTINQVAEHIDAFFGSERASGMRMEVLGRSPGERELYVTEKAIEALTDVGADFVLPFRFKKSSGARTSHYLVFATKSFKGYDLMKDVMAKACDTDPDGVPTFEYCEADERYPKLFGYSSGVDTLKAKLLDSFSGRTTFFENMYKLHSVGLPYVRENYRLALRQLEEAGHITVSRPRTSRQNTFGPKAAITFADGK